MQRPLVLNLKLSLEGVRRRSAGLWNQHGLKLDTFLLRNFDQEAVNIVRVSSEVEGPASVVCTGAIDPLMRVDGLHDRLRPVVSFDRLIVRVAAPQPERRKNRANQQQGRESD